MENERLRMRIMLKFKRQCKFALYMKIDEGAVSRVVNGYKQLPSDKKEKWAKALDCKVEDIF